MKNNDIRSILAGIAEEEAPSSEINLWNGIRQRLETSETKFRNGEKSMSRVFALKSTRRFALALVAVLAIFVLVLATPQGQAIGKSILSVFNKFPGGTLVASLQEAKDRLGADILLPPGEVDNQVLGDVDYYSGDGTASAVVLYYGSSIVVIIQKGELPSLAETYAGTPGEYEYTVVRGQEALYSQGCTENGSPVWNWDCNGLRELIWFENGIQYNIHTSYALDVSRDTLFAIAESMK